MLPFNIIKGDDDDDDDVDGNDWTNRAGVV